MGSVGDYDDVVEVVVVGDGCEAADLLLGVGGAGFGDDVAEGDAVGEEIVAAYSTFGVSGVFVGASAEGDDERGDLFAVEFDGVVEASVEDGRGMAGVLGCSEDGDGVGGLSVVHAGDGSDLAADPDAPGGGDEKEEDEQTEDATAGRTPASQIGFRDNHLPNDLDRGA